MNKIISYTQYDAIFKRKEKKNINKYMKSISWVSMSNQCKIIDYIIQDDKKIVLKDNYKIILKNYTGLLTS